MKPVTAQEAWDVLQHADCLYKQPEIEAALDVMADAITRKLADMDPLLVCIMNGGLVPFGRLLTLLHFPLQIDYIHATRYGRGLVGGDIQWTAGPAVPIQNRVVLLVDDILDEGTTLAAIEARFRAEGASAIYKAVLAVKKRPRKFTINVDFAGLEVPDRYVFGYGMDYKGYLRNAPAIYAVADS